jgi:hypothetical protein
MGRVKSQSPLGHAEFQSSTCRKHSQRIFECTTRAVNLILMYRTPSKLERLTAATAGGFWPDVTCAEVWMLLSLLSDISGPCEHKQ